MLYLFYLMCVSKMCCMYFVMHVKRTKRDIVKKKVLLVNVVRTSLDLSDTETTELRVC